jgi:2-methylcitrate dehydratase PrpD
MEVTATQELLARFATRLKYGDIPELALAKARDAIVDCIGVMVAGTGEPSSAAVAKLLQLEGASTGPCLLIGRLESGKPTEAALYNGVLAHALDYDDVTHPANSHFSAVLVPAIMATLPGVHPLSIAFITAYVAGYEVGAKLGRLLTRDRRRGEWHPTGVFGTIAASAAVANALELGANEASTALGTAASCCSGLRVNLGTMTKPLHAGRAAEAGVLAAFLAAAGFSASHNAFGNRGFFPTYASAEVQDSGTSISKTIASLGEDWELCADEGLAIKPYPSCAGTHPAIEAALLLRRRVAPADIRSVYIGTSAAAPSLLVYHRPTSALEAKFSIEYCVAVALLFGKVSLGSFSDNAVQDRRVTDLIDRTMVSVDDRTKASTEHAALIRLTLQNGTVHEELMTLASGKPQRWLTERQLHRKFLECAEIAVSRQEALNMLRSLTSQVSDEDHSWSDYLRWESGL